MNLSFFLLALISSAASFRLELRNSQSTFTSLGGSLGGDSSSSKEEQIASLGKERLESYLNQQVRPWDGNWDILKRKREVPSDEYTKSQDVVSVIMNALGETDSPQLDHGAAVVLSFSSPKGALAKSTLCPSAYGKFMRDKHESLLNTRKWEVLEVRPKSDSSDVEEREIVQVKAYGWGSILSSNAEDDEGVYDFHMSRESPSVGGQWLVDVILRRE
jgi:hypothetical protein